MFHCFSKMNNAVECAEEEQGSEKYTSDISLAVLYTTHCRNKEPCSSFRPSLPSTLLTGYPSYKLHIPTTPSPTHRSHLPPNSVPTLLIPPYLHTIIASSHYHPILKITTEIAIMQLFFENKNSGPFGVDRSFEHLKRCCQHRSVPHSTAGHHPVILRVIDTLSTGSRVHCPVPTYTRASFKRWTLILRMQQWCVLLHSVRNSESYLSQLNIISGCCLFQIKTTDKTDKYCKLKQIILSTLQIQTTDQISTYLNQNNWSDFYLLQIRTDKIFTYCKSKQLIRFLPTEN
jgi:hypothetical protein